jgi:hypothetical protein
MLPVWFWRDSAPEGVDQVAGPLTELSYPAPRALRDVHYIRRELCTIYREAKSGLIEPALFGRLVACLTAILQLENGKLLDDRLAEVERRIAAIKPNGHYRSEARP